MSNESVLRNWIEAYERAWASNDENHIRALFTEDADYFTEPHASPWHGHDAIVWGWLEARDEPGETTFEWTPLVVTDEIAIAQATTVYAGGATYSNLWVLRFAPDGRAREFTEWWMEQPPDAA
ncbi:nuclear transport factor 2 family protein [Planctomonas psychrotolerans]|uniref:nuclear transport factor 2 family protein n=1 Tax=Planctomonas psychrotolerans TaxID=2528712 RepID=UPI0012390FE6|nr:nuclear transport factor 2 family protein [Planctomonas psychrotolerans]